MKPFLLEWGAFHVASYGTILSLAIIFAVFVTNREYQRHNINTKLAWDIYLIAVFGGILGSKILYIIENFSAFRRAPFAVGFSPSGFSVFGGYLLAFALAALRIRKAGKSFFLIADLTAPGLALGYAIGRLGCLAAGDGCYGLPTECWWAMHFPKGLVSTLSAENLNLTRHFLEIFPGKQLPIDIGVHPTPVYECLSQLSLFLFLFFVSWPMGPGRRFAFFLGWFGFFRFFVEFIRLNPIWLGGLTSDQWIAMIMVLAGVIIACRRCEDKGPGAPGAEPEV